VAEHRVLVSGEEICAGLTIGSRRLHAFPERTVSTIEIEATGPAPVLSSVRGFHAGAESIPIPPPVEEYRAGDGDMILM
jgi:alpha-L-fucosidase